MYTFMRAHSPLCFLRLCVFVPRFVFISACSVSLVASVRCSFGAFRQEMLGLKTFLPRNGFSIKPLEVIHFQQGSRKHRGPSPRKDTKTGSDLDELRPRRLAQHLAGEERTAGFFGRHGWVRIPRDLFSGFSGFSGTANGLAMVNYGVTMV